MTKLCWWKLCKHTIRPRHATRFCLQTLCCQRVSVWIFIFSVRFRILFCSVFERQSKLMNWQCSFHWSLCYTALTAHTHDTNVTTAKEKELSIYFYIYALKASEGEKGQNQNDSSLTHKQTQSHGHEWPSSFGVKSLYEGRTQSLFLLLFAFNFRYKFLLHWLEADCNVVACTRSTKMASDVKIVCFVSMCRRRVNAGLS